MPAAEPDPDVRAAPASPGGPFGARPARPRLQLAPAVLLAIAVGGFVGGLVRYAIGEGLPTSTGGFPWATYLVNVTGAFGLALLLVLVIEVWRPTRYVRPAVGTGFFGAYTTWSTYMVQTDQLFRHGHAATAAAYVLASASSGLAAAAIAVVAGRRMFVRRGRADGPERN